MSKPSAHGERRESGIALLEILVLGFAVLLMVIPILSTAARLTEANGDVHAAARDSALWVTRHGSPPPYAEGVDVHVIKSAGVVEVVATREVEVIGVGGTSLTWTVQSTVEVPISAFRSQP